MCVLAEHTSGPDTPVPILKPLPAPKAKHDTYWTPEDEEKLAQWVSEGKTVKEIACKLGRTELAVEMRRDKKGLVGVKRKLELTNE